MSGRLPGDRNPNAKFTGREIRTIRRLWSIGHLTCKQIAQCYRCTERTIYGIVRGETYIVEGFNRVANTSRQTKKGARHNQVKLTEAQVIEIRQLLDGGMRRADVAEKFGVSVGHIGAIQRRINWGHLP